MRIKISASIKEQFPTPGPYKTLDIVERETLYEVGDTTHYGEVILILPPITWLNEDVEQSVVVKLDPTSLGTWCEESVMEKPPTSYDRIEFSPISVSTVGWSDNPPLTGPYTILSSENLTIENVSHLITPDTFSLWTNGCFVSKRTAESLQSVRFAIVHRYSSPNGGDVGPQTHSAELIDSAGSCLALIRPTRRGRAMHIRGIVKSNGAFDPQGFSAREGLADVPEIQKLFGGWPPSPKSEHNVGSLHVDQKKKGVPHFSWFSRSGYRTANIGVGSDLRGPNGHEAALLNCACGQKYRENKLDRRAGLSTHNSRARRDLSGR